MKIENLVNDLEPVGREEQVCQFIMTHPNEVYGYYDPDLKKAFPNINQESLGWYLYDLAKKNKISKFKIHRKVYFGSPEAISNLKRLLSKKEGMVDLSEAF